MKTIEGEVTPKTLYRNVRLYRCSRTLRWSTGTLNNGGPYFEMNVSGQPVLLEPHDVLPLINALFEFMIEAAKPKSN